MLYTRKGDNGTTKAFDSKPGERISKSSCQAESLGVLDELNSFLGLIKVKAVDVSWNVKGKRPEEIIHWLQNCLFSVQAEAAGAEKRVGEKIVGDMEEIIDEIERELPPIKSFFISGGTEIAALFDIARTMARKAERRIVKCVEDGELKMEVSTMAFLNRLSSMFYALARLSNHKSGIKEQPPTY